MFGAIPFEKLQKTCAVIYNSGDAIFLLFLACKADLDVLCSGSFSHYVKQFYVYERDPHPDGLCEWYAPLFCQQKFSKRKPEFHDHFFKLLIQFSGSIQAFAALFIRLTELIFANGNRDLKEKFTRSQLCLSLAKYRQRAIFIFHNW